MKKVSLLVFLICISGILTSVSSGKDLPKIAVWDLSPGDIKPVYAQDLTSILVSEITKLGKYEVYSQENVRTLAGWTAERMTLGCTDTKCLTALGQMDISKLISGRIGKIGNRYSVSLNLFDTQNAKAENAVSELGRSEDELIDLVQLAVKRLLGEEVGISKSIEKVPEKEMHSWIEDKRGIDQLENGKIDWTQRIIYANGTAFSPKAVKSVSEATMQEAKTDAIRNIIEVIKRIRVDPSRVAGDSMVSKDEIYLKDLVRSSMKVTDMRYYSSDGAVKIIVAFGMNEEFMRLIDNLQKRSK
jgi:hypothetical protein